MTLVVTRQMKLQEQKTYLGGGKRGGKTWSILRPEASVLLLSHH